MELSIATESEKVPNQILFDNSSKPQRKINYLPYGESREIVRALGLNSYKEWRTYCKSNSKPENIPTYPSKIYKKCGWKNWKDWLGHGIVYKKNYLAFEEARLFVHNLGLKSSPVWKLYCKSGQKPVDIPSCPNLVYSNCGWIGYGDWLGTNTIANYNRQYLPFNEVKEFALSLKLKKGDEWKEYAKDGKLPKNIPAGPHLVYKNCGWTNWGDFLGTHNIANFRRTFLPYKDACKFVKNLLLENTYEWRDYCKSGEKPAEIPSSPDKFYKDKGWISYGEWLGTGREKRKSVSKFISFKKARDFVRGLGLKNSKEWAAYCESGARPFYIPSSPHDVYKNKGFQGMGNWLGTENVASFKRIFLPFEEARSIIHQLNFGSITEWDRYCLGGKRPSNIPSSPNYTYKGMGWKDWNDWLNTNNVASYKKEFLPFEEARELARTLGLRTGDEWHVYCKSGKRPNNIPGDPHATYRDEGWVGWRDWLGSTELPYRERHWRSFEEACHFVKKLQLKDSREWLKYCKSGDKPEDIPANPQAVYEEKGWVGWKTWLGTDGCKSSRYGKYCSYREAWLFVRTLGLRNTKEWVDYCKSGKKPSYIPGDPKEVYKDAGWLGMGQWLGTNRIATSKRKFLPYDQAKEQVQKLNLKNIKEWRAYCNSEKIQNYIPKAPNLAYKNGEWKSWSDWLGTKNLFQQKKDFLSFEEARQFICSLNLKGISEWRIYCKSGSRPQNIPAAPERVYKNVGWNGWGDWFGTGSVAPYKKEYLPFEEARRAAQALKLKNRFEWLDYCKSGKKPFNIPTNPNMTYKNDGWNGLGDWLGTGNLKFQKANFLPFESAKLFVQTLGLKSREEWRVYCEDGKRPSNIPSNPNSHYKDQGWKDWPDWVGSHRISNFNKKFLSFDEAKKIIQLLGLKSESQWRHYCRSGKRPADIPSSPNKTYKATGWINWNDWLGPRELVSRKKQYRAFEEAKAYIHMLKLKSEFEWRIYCKSGNRPVDIPSSPSCAYKAQGWKGWIDFLGPRDLVSRKKDFLSFNEAKSFVQGIALKGESEWRIYSKSGNKPQDIPAAPERVYKNDGWNGYGDWLGTGNIALSKKEFFSFDEARLFARDLGLKSYIEWKDYCRSGKRPAHIPSNPNQKFKESGWINWRDWLGMGLEIT